MIHAVSGLVFVHGDVKHPMQAVFNSPMRADNVLEAFGGQGRAEKIIGCFILNPAVDGM